MLLLRCTMTRCYEMGSLPLRMRYSRTVFGCGDPLGWTCVRCAALDSWCPVSTCAEEQRARWW
jgi:hypothetical protein